VRVGRLIGFGTWCFPIFFKWIKFVAMHHCRKFFNPLQELFAALQQKDEKPCFLIKNKGLEVYINSFNSTFKALFKEIIEQKSTQK
jgi:hypothetical protein